MIKYSVLAYTGLQVLFSLLQSVDEYLVTASLIGAVQVTSDGTVFKSVNKWNAAYLTWMMEAFV